jgi:hypothetical protein
MGERERSGVGELFDRAGIFICVRSVAFGVQR